MAVAFVTSSGLDEIRRELLEKLESGRFVRMIMDLKSAATDPSAVWDLLTLVEESNNRLQLRTHAPGEGILHSKLYIGINDQDVSVLTGSANLSSAAFHSNVEYGFGVSGSTDDNSIAESAAFFDSVWNSVDSYTIDEETARLYELYSGRKRATLNRANRRSRANWQDLVGHLLQGGIGKFEWPSLGAAYVLGAIAARGAIDPNSSIIRIRLLFRAKSYGGGRIAVRDLSFQAADVLPSIPQALAQRARSVFPDTPITVDGMTVSIDLANDPETFDIIEGLFVPANSCHSFRIPREVMSGDVGMVVEFVRGFAVASGLLTDSTSMPGNQITGLPGQMTVWLRPKQGNKPLFNQLYEVIRRRLGITTYRHWRENREPHLKLICEDFAEIGFGIDWWDRLVNSGATYNQSLFGQGD